MKCCRRGYELVQTVGFSPSKGFSGSLCPGLQCARAYLSLPTSQCFGLLCIDAGITVAISVGLLLREVLSRPSSKTRGS